MLEIFHSKRPGESLLIILTGVSVREVSYHLVGYVEKAEILRNGAGSSKGCAVLKFERSKHARRAIRKLNNTRIDGRTIFVREDREDPDVSKVRGERRRSPERRREESRHRESKKQCTAYISNVILYVYLTIFSYLFEFLGRI